MKITRDTTIVDLYCNDIMDGEFYDMFQRDGLETVGAIINGSQNNIEDWNKQIKGTNDFITFLQGIINIQELFNNLINPNEALFGMPNSLRLALNTVYNNEIQRFGADYIFEIMLGGQACFFRDVLSDIKILFSDSYFNEHVKNDRYISDNYEIEKERYQHALVSLIIHLGKTLENFPDCNYYAKVISATVKECDITQEQFKSAEDYANLLNSGKPNIVYYDILENISTSHSEGNIQLSNEIQSKYYDLMSELSVRTRNVLKTNIKDYTELLPWIKGDKTEFKFRNCGNKTIHELNCFVKEFGDYYNQHINVIVDTEVKNVKDDKIQALSYLIGLEMGKRNQFEKEVNDLIREVYPQQDSLAIQLATDPNLIYKSLKEHNKKLTLDSLMLLVQVFSNILIIIRNNEKYLSYCSYFSVAISTFKIIMEEYKNELEYDKYITQDKDLMIRNIFQHHLSGASVQCRNAIINNNLDYVQFLKYSRNDYDFRNLRQVGRKCAEELGKLLLSFIEEYEHILKGDIINVRKGKIKNLFPFLSEDDIEFVNFFESQHNHYPMLYVLYCYFKTTNNVSAQIFALYSGLTNNLSFSYSSIANQFNLTTERVRQILSKKSFLSDIHFQNVMDQNMWDGYSIKFDDYTSISNTDYIKYCTEEQVDFSFYSYCNILSLFSNVKLLIVSESGKVLSSLDIEQCQIDGVQFNIYAYDFRFHLFKFISALKEVRRLYRLQRDKTIKIPLYSYFISNEEYWINEEIIDNENDFNVLLLFFEKIIKDTYGDCVDNHNLIMKSNKLNYSEIIYNIIKEHGKSMSLHDIFERLKEICPDNKYNEPKQIKPYLFKDERIKNIGRSSIYTLAEWNDYTGNLFELAVDLVEATDKPIKIEELAQEMLVFRPSSNEHSVQSIINICINDGRLVQFCDDSVGFPQRIYKGDFILKPRSFDEWMTAFKEYTIKNGCFPIGGTKGFECALYNWYNETRTYINLTSEEILQFHQLMKDLERIPHNTIEKKFYDNCESYKKFVQQSGRMLNLEDEKSMFYWFSTNLKKYVTYEDNRRLYFKELINFLQDQIDVII